jgi:alkaline phosphatase
MVKANRKNLTFVGFQVRKEGQFKTREQCVKDCFEKRAHNWIRFYGEEEMIKLKVKAQVAAAFVTLALILSVSAAQAAAKNVILMIPDGQGYNTIKATDYYSGNKGVYESWEVQYGVSTFSAGTVSVPSSGYNPNQAWKNFG